MGRASLPASPRAGLDMATTGDRQHSVMPSLWRIHHVHNAVKFSNIRFYEESNLEPGTTKAPITTKLRTLLLTRYHSNKALFYGKEFWQQATAAHCEAAGEREPPVS